MSAAKLDCEALLGELMPFAEQCLSRHREFFPFGATMSASGKIAMASGYDGREHPPSNDLIAMLTQAFQLGAQSGQTRATGLIYDALTIPPGKDVKQDTIACKLDHRDNYSVVVYFPYEFDENANLVIDDPYAICGDYSVFGRKTD